MYAAMLLYCPKTIIMVKKNLHCDKTDDNRT